MNSNEQAKRIDEVLGLIERNREENRKRDKGEYDGLFSSRFNSLPLVEGDIAHDEDEHLSPREVKLVIHAAPGPMCDTLVATMKTRTVVAAFATPEETINFTLEYGARHILMDLDSPTDTHGCVDVFSVLRTLIPTLGVYVCTRNSLSIEARTLQFKGAVLIPKPFLFREADQVIHFMKLTQ